MFFICIIGLHGQTWEGTVYSLPSGAVSSVALFRSF